jgi:DNA-binding transcriptional LysR family regulator
MSRISDVDLRLLRVFVAVVEAGGYAAAQTVLNIGNSTISIHMSDLEQRLGFRLCVRGRGGFGLTDRGRTAYQEAKKLLNAIDDFSGSMAALKKRLSGRLRLGMVDCLVTHPRFPLVEAIRRFNELDNSVHIELIIKSRTELEQAVLAGQLHAAIGPYVRKISGLDLRTLFRERHDLYCGAEHPLFDRDDISTSDIEDYDFVLRSYHEHFDIAQLEQKHAAATVNNLEGMLVMLLSGSYLGFLADHYAEAWVEAGRLRAIGRGSFAYDSSHVLMMAAASRTSAALGTLVSLLNDQIQRNTKSEGSSRCHEPSSSRDGP